MSRRLPPLNALRAFEAAARHLSFTKAAEELFVTQAAVSHQVKSLEDHLGVPLFRRFNRRLAMTDAAQSYYPALRDALDAIDQATRRLQLHDDDTMLRVSVLPSLAAKWLMPRLPEFRRLHPEVDVLISAADGLVDFGREDFHMGIRFGAGRYPGLSTTLLMADTIFPVCAPKLLAGENALRKPTDLKHLTLLHDDMARRDESSNDWESWLTYAGVTGVDPHRGPAFSHSSMVLTAAIDGQGVALGRLSLAVDDMAAGRLVCPFGPVMEAPLAYYAVSPRAIADRPMVSLFREWLQREAAATEEHRVTLPGD
jgi:LysR family glycine cleavage system transcriptional activator